VNLVIRFIASIGAAAFLSIACGEGGGSSPTPPAVPRLTTPQPLGSGGTEVHEITISGNAFSPRRLVVGAGQSISIKVMNDDSVTHTLNVQNGPASGDIFAGFETSIALTTPQGSGGIAFACSIHPSMTGTIAYE
jgi:plastocyanin